MREGATILVTGAAGFIGRRQCAYLRARGYDVRETDRRDGTDIARRDAAQGAVRGVDAVIHLAAMADIPRSFDDPGQCRRDTVETTACLVEAAREFGVSRFVLASSAAVYGDAVDGPAREDVRPAPASPYARAKLDAEELVAEFASGAVSLRYFNVYGPGERASAGVVAAFASALREGRPMVLHGDGGQTRDFIHVDDVVRANLAALTCPHELAGRPVNVGTGRSVSIRRVGEMMAGVAGCEPRFERREASPGDVRHSCADVDLARRVLGFEAWVVLEDGLREVLESHG